uniref:Uncharacterized protein n=1 Tax=Glossina austeni TaxID=7395 RepID=A0A1A9VY44_GLOAU
MFPENILLPMSANGSLVCNYVSRIAEPITWCSTKCSFRSLQGKQVVKTIIEISGGHIHRTTTTLHSCYRLMGTRHQIPKTYMFQMSGTLTIYYNLDEISLQVVCEMMAQKIYILSGYGFYYCINDQRLVCKTFEIQTRLRKQFKILYVKKEKNIQKAQEIGKRAVPNEKY